MKLIRFTLLTTLVACGGTTVVPHGDLSTSVVGRCMAKQPWDGFSIGTRGPFTVIVRQGDQTLWQGSAKDRQTLDVPIRDLIAKAGGPVEIDVFGGDHPAGTTLPPGSDAALAKQLVTLGDGAPKVSIGRPDNIVPICSPTDGCNPVDCPPPPPPAPPETK